jgi:hypothetical protein
VVEEAHRDVLNEVQVFVMSQLIATPPSLPMITWFRVRRIDPDRVHVVVNRLRRVERDRLAAVRRLVQLDARVEDRSGSFGRSAPG